jgi:hypothetical protein
MCNEIEQALASSNIRSSKYTVPGTAQHRNILENKNSLNSSYNTLQFAHAFVEDITINS